MDVDETQKNKAPRPPRRWFRWRRRDPDPSIATVMAQWLEYELIFNDILTRLNAQLARQAKMEKRRLAREHNPAERTAPLQAPTTKQQLRSQYALSRFGGRIQHLMDAKTQLGGPSELTGQSSEDAVGATAGRGGNGSRADGPSDS